jgi:hypothetical protein
MIINQMARFLLRQPASQPVFPIHKKILHSLSDLAYQSAALKRPEAVLGLVWGFFMGRKKTDPQVNDHTLGNLVENLNGEAGHRRKVGIFHTKKLFNLKPTLKRLKTQWFLCMM